MDFRIDRAEEAEVLLLQAISGLTNVAASSKRDNLLLASRSQLAGLYHVYKPITQANPLLRSEETYKEAYNFACSSTPRRQDVQAFAAYDLAEILRQNMKLEEAAKYYKKAGEVWNRVLPRYAQTRIIVNENLARIEMLLGQFDKAKLHLQDSIESRKLKLKRAPEHDRRGLISVIAEHYAMLGEIAEKQGNYPIAKATYLDAQEQVNSNNQFIFDVITEDHLIPFLFKQRDFAELSRQFAVLNEDDKKGIGHNRSMLLGGFLRRFNSTPISFAQQQAWQMAQVHRGFCSALLRKCIAENKFGDQEKSAITSLADSIEHSTNRNLEKDTVYVAAKSTLKQFCEKSELIKSLYDIASSYPQMESLSEAAKPKLEISFTNWKKTQFKKPSRKPPINRTSRDLCETSGFYGDT
ncbi:MAG: tetratricopeptide repeat protein [Candidatus Obscuribacter sp.]|nr:tetratricopeptide repeat protein [Candidatus Obscuribacter sp.]